MNTLQFLDYNNLFKPLYKVPSYETIDRTHIFVSERLDSKTVGLILRDHMELIHGTKTFSV